MRQVRLHVRNNKIHIIWSNTAQNDGNDCHRLCVPNLYKNSVMCGVRRDTLVSNYIHYSARQHNRLLLFNHLIIYCSLLLCQRTAFKGMLVRPRKLKHIRLPSNARLSFCIACQRTVILSVYRTISKFLPKNEI